MCYQKLSFPYLALLCSLVLSGCGGSGGGGGTAATVTPATNQVDDGAADTTPTTAEPASDEAAVDDADTIVSEDAELRINEIVAKDVNDGFDWIELYVSGDSNVYIGDYSVSDERGASSVLPSITLAPGEFYRLYATTESDTGLATVNFRLGASDSVKLSLGNDLIDQLEWDKGEALFGYSYGRSPDGSDGVRTLVPTPGASNIRAAHTPLVINEVVAGRSDEGSDWFELYNSSNEAIALADFQIIDESEEVEPISLPELTLGAGEYVIVQATSNDPGDHWVALDLDVSDELTLMSGEDTIDYIDWDGSDVPGDYSYGLTEGAGWNKDTLVPTPGAENEEAPTFDRDTVRTLEITMSSADWQDILNRICSGFANQLVKDKRRRG